MPLSLKLTLPVMLLLGGCATPNVGAIVQTPEPLKPLIPANLRTLPAEATVDLEELILRLVSGSARSD